MKECIELFSQIKIKKDLYNDIVTNNKIIDMTFLLEINKEVGSYKIVSYINDLNIEIEINNIKYKVISFELTRPYRIKYKYNDPIIGFGVYPGRFYINEKNINVNNFKEFKKIVERHCKSMILL